MPSLKEQADALASMLKEKTGDFMEQSLESRIEGTKLEAPILDDKPKPGTWYKFPIEGGMSGDGSEYHIYMKFRRTKKLCIIISGGGIAWNQKMAAYPTTGARKLTWQPHYYWNNLRPVTQIMNINVGITENLRRNPFDGWNMAVISYSTADLHVGDSSLEFVDEDGNPATLHFSGYRNFTLAMSEIRHKFPDVDQILIAGDSAGAFAVPALAPEILTTYYPTVMDVTLLSDSAQLEREGWQYTLKQVWNAPERLYKSDIGPNLTVSWMQYCMERLGSRCRYLYASSRRDYLLSAYQNEVLTGEFSTDEEIQGDFKIRLEGMIEELRELPQRVHFFINDITMNPAMIGRGGTIHTLMRTPQFHTKTSEGVSMAQWLEAAVSGNLYDIGLE